MLPGARDVKLAPQAPAPGISLSKGSQTHKPVVPERGARF